MRAAQRMANSLARRRFPDRPISDWKEIVKTSRAGERFLRTLGEVPRMVPVVGAPPLLWRIFTFPESTSNSGTTQLFWNHTTIPESTYNSRIDKHFQNRLRSPEATLC